VASRLNAEPHSYLREGQRVKVSDGPLRGAEGLLVQKKGTLHFVISITMLQRSVSVEINRDSITTGSPIESTDQAQ
jgi:hypothetical protein